MQASNKAKKKMFLWIISIMLLIGSFLLTGESSKTYAANKSKERVKTTERSNMKKEIRNKDGSIILTKLNNEVWVHTTYTEMDGYLVPANGLIINSSKGIYLIDTTWNEPLANELLKMIKQNFHKQVKKAIITHHKIDRLGGVPALLKNKIPVESTSFISKSAKKEGYSKIAPTLDRSPVLKLGKTTIETYYPGEGHTSDNIVVWLPKYKLLFGDMIFALEQQNVGIIDEANMSAWPYTIQNLINKYPNAKIVVPGHKSWGDFSLLPHTIENLKNVDK